MTITTEQLSSNPHVFDRVPDQQETASYAAARLLEIATSNADALVEDARAEADAILARARAEADALGLEAEQQRAELDRAHGEVLRELEERRAALEAEVNDLGEFERRCRDHLVSYLNDQLEAVQRPVVEDDTADSAAFLHLTRGA